MAREELLLIIALPVVAVLMTAGITLTLGRRLASHSRLLAVLGSGAAVPLLGLATTLIFDAREPGDGSALAIAGTLILAGLALPVTLLTSALVLRRSGRTPVSPG